MSGGGGKQNPFISSLKGIIGADVSPGHHIHDHMMNQEKWVLWSAIVLFFMYFGLEFWFIGDKLGLFNDITSSGFFPLLIKTIVTVWKTKLLRIFVVLNIMLILLGLYALVNVWPLRQNMKVFGLKPHGAHGHDAHGHSPAANAKAPHPQHTGNPATLKHWSSIVHRANTGTPENLRWAVMEADALVDHVLRSRGIAGDTMADRLQNARWAGAKLVDRVFDAHRLRNELAHTPGYQMTSKQAERALFTFRDFLKELKEF